MTEADVAALRLEAIRLEGERDHLQEQYNQLLTLPPLDRYEFGRYRELCRMRGERDEALREVSRLRAAVAARDGLLREVLADDAITKYSIGMETMFCTFCFTGHPRHTAACWVSRARALVGEGETNE